MVLKKLCNKKKFIYFLSFIAPIIMVCLYILFKELITEHYYFMNGENFVVADMKNQYISLYNYVYNILHGADSIFYSFHNSLGGNMASTIGYYLSSPLNLLYLFATKTNIPLWTFIIYLIKIGLCSLFMNIYISHKFGSRYSNLIFSLSYAFMGFISINYFNTMWIDVIYMTPLVIMGIDKLIDGKPLQYIITLSLSIIFNFYIAYMLCIFCVMYFIYEIFIRYSIKDFKSYKKIILRFIISSLLAGGLSAFFLMPVLLNLNDAFRFSLNKSKLIINFNSLFSDFIFKIVTNIYLGSEKKFEMIFRERPILYICSFCLILSIFYFFNKKIKVKEKILSLFVVLFFILSFMIPHLELFWQANSFPNGYAYRFAFLYCFFIILLSAKQFYSKDKANLFECILFFVVYTIISIIVINYNYDFMKKNDILLSILLVMVYLFIYYLSNKLKIRNILNFFLLIFILLELIINYSKLKVTKYETYNDKTNYEYYYNTMCNKLSNLENNFYRIGEQIKYNNLDSYICNLYSMNTELSTNNKKLYNFVYNNGGKVTHVIVEYDYDKLPILDSILGIKYSVGAKMYNDYYRLNNNYNVDNSFSNDGNVFIYLNPYALSLGYAINDNFDKIYHNVNGFRLDNLNNLVKSLSGIDDNIIIKIPYTNHDEYREYKIKENISDIYAVFDYKISTNFSNHGTLNINNKKLYIDDSRGGINRIQLINSTNKILFSNISDNIDIYSYDFYYFNYDAFKKAIDILKQHQLENIKINGNKMSADIDLDKDSLVMITIPYDKGWKVYVDGKKVKYREVADTFIGINIPKGDHKIHMVFYPRWMIIGIIISFINLLLTIFYLKNVSKSLNINKN